MDIDLSKPFQVIETNADDFLVTMGTLGKQTQEMSLVGSFADPDDQTVRTAHRDIDLPFHRDGIRTESIAALQAGFYIERPNVDVVGMYCIRDNGGETHTVLAEDEAGEKIVADVVLRAGQALVWDNRLWHGRYGPVGQRVLIRFWVTCPALYEVRP